MTLDIFSVVFKWGRFNLAPWHRCQIFEVYLGSCVQLYSLAETPQLPAPTPPHFGLIYEGAIGQPR